MPTDRRPPHADFTEGTAPVSTPHLTLTEELGHFLRSATLDPRSRTSVDERARQRGAVRDPWALLDAAAVVMQEIVTAAGFEYADVVEKLVTSTPRNHVSAEVRRVMVDCVRSGEHTWNPITDVVGVTTDDHADWIHEAHAAVKQCLCDPSLAADPVTWAALEMHYRRTFPDVWPPADDQGVEFYVSSAFEETTPGQWRPSNVVLGTVEETAEGELNRTERVLAPADAQLLIRLISYELTNPRPVPAHLLERAADSDDSGTPKTGLRVVRDEPEDA